MPLQSSMDDSGFRRILLRNITLPLAAGVVSAGVFVVLLAYLITTMNWVEHSERVIGSANEIGKQMVDMETGMRGYMLAGDEVFLEPYVLPLQFKGTDSWESLGLTGNETINVLPDPALTPQSDATLVIRRADGSSQEVVVTLRIDTPIEVDYYQAGGILPFVLRQLLEG